MRAPRWAGARSSWLPRRPVLVLSALLTLNIFALWRIYESSRPSREPPRVSLVFPAGEVSTRQVISITFSKFVIPSEPAAWPSADGLIRLDPEVSGSARWTSPSQLLFRPALDLPHGQRFRILLSSEIGHIVGTTLEGPNEFFFSTEPLKLLSASQCGFTRELEATIRLVFNDEVYPPLLRRHLKVLDSHEKELPFTFQDGEPASQIDIRSRSDDESLVLAFGPAARPRDVEDGRSRAAPAHLPSRLAPAHFSQEEAKFIGIAPETRFTVFLTHNLKVTEARGERVSRERPALEVYFSNPIEEKQGAAPGFPQAKLQEFFSVDPPIPFTTVVQWSKVLLSGEFQPGSRYRLTVKKGLRGAGGSLLSDDVVREVFFPDRQPELSFRNEGTFLSSQGNLTLLLEAVNLKQVEVNTFRIHPNNLVHYLKIGRHLESFTRELAPRLYKLPPGKSQIRELAIDLRDLTGPDPRGAWYVDAFGEGLSASQLISVSDIGLTVKESPQGIIVWTTSLKSGDPVSGATVSLRTASNQLVAELTTGDNGLASFRGPLGAEDGAPFVVLAAKSGDQSFLELEKHRLSRAEFDVTGRPYLEKGYEAFLFTDRGAYRPGETVRLRGLVRGPSAQLPGSFPVEVEIFRPDGKRFRLELAHLNDQGSLETVLKLPSTAATGLYRGHVKLPGGSAPSRGETEGFGSVSFQVEEYMPNRLEAKVLLSKGGDSGRRFHPGESVELLAKGKYLLGVPAEGCSVEIAWSLSGDPFRPRGWKGFQFGELSPATAAFARGMQSLLLDALGEANFRVDLPEVGTSSGLSLDVMASVKDVAGRAVSGSLRVPVDPAPMYLGIRLGSPDMPVAGQSARFECIALRPDGKPASLEAADLVVSKVRWSSVLKKSRKGTYEYQSHEDVQEILKKRVVLSEGFGAFEAIFEEQGAYRLRLKDPASLAVAECLTYASLPGSSRAAIPLERPERVELSFARPSYRPGETARVRVTAPFGGTLLLTTETDHVETARVMRMLENSMDAEVPVPRSADASIYVGATVVRAVNANSDWMPHRAYGIAPVPVDFSGKKLFLTLLAPEEIRPGGRGAARVFVTSEEGNPVKGAEVSMALVDQGVLSLTRYRTPDPFAYFYGKRAHGVELSDSYGSLLTEVPLGLERLHPGGDKEGKSAEAFRLNPIQAERVKSAAIWLGTGTSDENGSVVMDFALPQFTGALRFFAVAAAGERFGAAEREVLVRGPFLLEIGLPRFLSPGDSFFSPVAIFNRTDHPGAARLEWTLDGLLEGQFRPVENVAFASFKNAALDVPENGSTHALFCLRADDKVGKASAALQGTFLPHAASPADSTSLPSLDPRARGGEETFTETVELPVRPAAPHIHWSQSGQVTAEKPLELKPQRNFVPGTSRYRLILSPFPDTELSGSLRYLVEYPYGCLEQTTSRAFPLLYLRDLAERTGAVGYGNDPIAGDQGAKIDACVQAGIDRILEMQGYSGWLSMWPGGQDPWRWGSIYAAHFLVEAKGAGHSVPSPELESLLDYIQESMASSREAYDSEEDLERAYGLYVLALAKRPDGASMDALRDEALHPPSEKVQLSPSARFLLGAAYVLSGKGDTARALLGADLPPPGQARDTGGVLRSPARETAILLSALLEIDPSNPWVALLVTQLKSYRAQSQGVMRWGTTQENAFALLALGKYARWLSTKPQEASLEVQFCNRPLVTLQGGESRVMDAESLDGGIAVSLKGPGTFFYFWSEEGVPADGRVEEVDSGLKVRRRFLDRHFQPLDLAAIPYGELILIELELEADDPLSNIVVTDLLPAGLEVENAWLGSVAPPAAVTGGGGSPEEGKPSLLPHQVSLRDDRAIFFFNLYKKDGTYFYAARAVTRGDFRLPPIEAEAMYDPALRSISGAGRITVK